MSGTQAFRTQRLHEVYGPVVRIAPNHLSFTDPAAWRDIYGHLVGHKSGAQEMRKTTEFSRTIDDIPTSILNADREEHGRVRRALARGFFVSYFSVSRSSPFFLIFLYFFTFPFDSYFPPRPPLSHGAISILPIFTYVFSFFFPS